MARRLLGSRMTGENENEYKESEGLKGAGLPLTKQENPDGKKTLSNGMQRVHRIMDENELSQGKASRWTELEMRGRIKNIAPALWKLEYLTALFLNGNLLTRIPPEVAQLNNLTMLDLSNNKLRSLPSELGDIVSLCHLYLNNNQLRVLPYELGKLFRLQTLGLQGNPLSPEISKMYHETNGAQKLLQFLLDHLAIHSDPPPDRTWMMIRHADPERPIATFTVLNYNVLSNKYASQNIYSYCPSWALNWNYRKSAIIKEIRNYEADVITLQEVETQEYKMLFKPEMSALGYSSIFQAKSRAKTMHEEDRKFVDGCAIFWKNDKFDLAREQLIEFNRVAISKCSANENMLNRVQPRDNIALCAVLKIKESVYNNRNVLSRPMPPSDNVVGSPLIVCTAHIHWDPEFCDVKLVQTMMLTHELWKLVEEVAESHRIQPHQVPTLICGDLNSLPDSGVFEFISKSGISRSHPDLKAFKEDAVLEKFSHSHDGSNYTHALRLDSAVENAVVPFTNFTMEFKGMIDYIFSTPQSLARLGVLGPFDMDYINANKIIGFPHAHVPSDHIPIMAQYALIPTNHQRPQPQIQHFGNQHSGPFGAVGR